jgi:AcrR family transcriptional regulator
MSLASGRRPRVGRPQGPAPDPTKRRTELLDAAMRAIRAGGPNTSMDDIAAEAGLTKPMLYASFKDKAGLATALAERLLSDLLPAVLSALDTNAAPRDMVRGAINTFFSFVEREPNLYRFLVRGVASADRGFIEQPFIDEFGLRLADAFRAAGIATERAEVSAFTVLGTVLAGAEWWHVRSKLSRKRVVDVLTDIVWGGISTVGFDPLGAAPVFGSQR